MYRSIVGAYPCGHPRGVGSWLDRPLFLRFDRLQRQHRDATRLLHRIDQRRGDLDGASCHRERGRSRLLHRAGHLRRGRSISRRRSIRARPLPPCPGGHGSAARAIGEPGVVGQVHATHPAHAKHLLDAVATVEKMALGELLARIHDNFLKPSLTSAQAEQKFPRAHKGGTIKKSVRPPA